MLSQLSDHRQHCNSSCSIDLKRLLLLATYVLCLFRQDSGPGHNTYSSDSHLAQKLLKEEELCLDQNGPMPKEATWQTPAAGTEHSLAATVHTFISVSCSTHPVHFHTCNLGPHGQYRQHSFGCNARRIVEHESVLTSHELPGLLHMLPWYRRSYSVHGMQVVF